MIIVIQYIKQEKTINVIIVGELFQKAIEHVILINLMVQKIIIILENVLLLNIVLNWKDFVLISQKVVAHANFINNYKKELENK